MSKLTAQLRGYENGARVLDGSTVVAQVYTRKEPGDQIKMATLFAASEDLLAELIDMTAKYEQLLVESHITKRDAEAMKAMIPHYTASARAAIAKATTL